VAGPYPYLGHQEMWYQGYLDDATGKMLIALPDESYSMSPVNEGNPVPPNDGRWPVPDVPASPADPEPVWSAPAPAPEQAEPEGGES
jgi:hypothetical protein